MVLNFFRFPKAKFKYNLKFSKANAYFDAVRSFINNVCLTIVHNNQHKNCSFFNANIYFILHLLLSGGRFMQYIKYFKYL